MDDVVRVIGHSNNAPHSVHVMLTTRCSLNCSRCFYRRAGPGEWTWKQAERMAREAAAMRVKWLAFGGGEPTEWSHLSRLLDLARSLGLKTAVTTNGCQLSAINPDRVHISHDRIHAKTDWAEREKQVLSAVKHYSARGAAVGLNVLATDLELVSENLLRQVDNVTLLLPKPANEKPTWLGSVRATIEQRRALTDFSVDSCLAVLLSHRCYQGRLSMSVDQFGRASACSNTLCAATMTWHGLADAWEVVRLRDGRCPAGCLATALV